MNFYTHLVFMARCILNNLGTVIFGEKVYCLKLTVGLISCIVFRCFKWSFKVNTFKDCLLNAYKIQCITALSPIQTTHFFLSVSTVSVPDYTILTPKILCREQETCQTTSFFLNILHLSSLTFCPDLSSERPIKKENLTVDTNLDCMKRTVKEN